MKRSSSPAPAGLTQRMAVASSRHPRRTIAIWGLIVLVSLVLVGTSLQGLTTSAHVVGATQSSQADALYDRAIGAAAGQKPTDVIVVSSKTGHRSATSLPVLSSASSKARSAPSPGITDVAHRPEPGQPAGLGRPPRSPHRICGRRATPTSNQSQPPFNGPTAPVASRSPSPATTPWATTSTPCRPAISDTAKSTSACPSPSWSCCWCSAPWSPG